jgi:hypothetical protein
LDEAAGAADARGVSDAGRKLSIALFTEKGVLYEHISRAAARELVRRNYAASTIRTYLRVVKEFGA